MSRTSSHRTETTSRILFEAAVNSFACDELGMSQGDAVFRQITERDYGIDGQVEIFHHGEPTGYVAHVQLKGTSSSIQKLVYSDEVSCPGISKSNLAYCRQKNVPVMLVYISTADQEFYFTDLQPVYQEKIQQIADKGSGTVRIPVQNNSKNFHRFFEIINTYYESAVRPPVKSQRLAPTLFEPLLTEKAAQEPEVELLTATYQIGLCDNPTDGEHKQIDQQGRTVKIGSWKNGELDQGTEYNWLIRVTKGSLLFADDDPDVCCGATEDFEYEKMEQYSYNLLYPFRLSTPYIEQEGLSTYYIVDLAVNGDMEQIETVCSLEEFLKEHSPATLQRLLDGIEYYAEIS